MNSLLQTMSNTVTVSREGQTMDEFEAISCVRKDNNNVRKSGMYVCGFSNLFL